MVNQPNLSADNNVEHSGGSKGSFNRPYHEWARWPILYLRCIMGCVDIKVGKASLWISLKMTNLFTNNPVSDTKLMYYLYHTNVLRVSYTYFMYLYVYLMVGIRDKFNEVVIAIALYKMSLMCVISSFPFKASTVSWTNINFTAIIRPLTSSHDY